MSEHFTKRKILLYSLPGIFDAFATASFQMVDGYFVSNLLGITAFAAVGLISPVFFLLYALGFMFGEGASAMISLCGSLAAPVLMLMAVPAVFGGDAIWYSMPLAMLLTSGLCVILLHRAYYRRKKLW